MLTERQKEVQARAREEIRKRGRRMYWQYKAKQALSVLTGIVVMALLIAAVFGYMLAFPD